MGLTRQCEQSIDDYDKVWYRKLPFLEVGKGDFVAIDIGSDDAEPVVYLSHDDGEGHGYILGTR